MCCLPSLGHCDLDPSIYTMDHPDLTVSSSIGLKRVNKFDMK